MTAPEGSTATLTVSASDPDGGTLSFSWDLDNDGTFELATNGVNTASFPVPDNGTFTYGVRVQDPDGNQVTATGTVIGTNVAPTITPIPDKQVEVGEALTVTLTASDPGGVSEFKGQSGWNVNSGNFSLDVAAGSPSFTWSHTYNSTGSYTAWAVISDKDGAWSDQVQFKVTVVPSTNQPPVAAAGGPYSGIEGVAIPLSAASSSDPEGGPLTFAWDTDNDGQYDDATGASTTVTFPDNGTYIVGVRVTDSKNASTTATATVTVSNSKPTMTFSAPTTVVEGTTIALVAFGASDAAADQGSLQITYSCDGGVTFGASATCAAVDGPATVSVVGRITDKDGAYTDYPRSVAVTNAAPSIASLTLPTAPAAMGTLVSLAATFSDAWVDDGHTATIDWGDASTTTGTVSAMSNPRSVSATHTYATPGVYTVTLTVKDDANAQDERTYQYVVVYDPTAGFVTGGGWIAYGATACPVLCGGASGRGDFGFVSRYQKGAQVPSGDTRFEFHAGTLRFVSVAYEWLVVSGSRAQYKGTGTIGGSGDYGFLVTAIDGTPDAFRIKVWDRASGSIVFDNQMGATDDSSAATLLNKVSGDGSIVIHTK